MHKFVNREYSVHNILGFSRAEMDDVVDRHPGLRLLGRLTFFRASAQQNRQNKQKEIFSHLMIFL